MAVAGTHSVLEGTDLAREDIAAYQQGEQTMADLTAKVDADLDPDRIDDARALIEKLAREARESDSQNTTS